MLRCKWSSTVFIVFVIFFNSLTAHLVPNTSDPFKDHIVSINTAKAVQRVSKKFLSVAFTIGLLQEHWAHFDFSSERPFTLARGLSPAFVRFGGTAEDWLHFGKTTTQFKHKNFTDFTMTSDDLDKINLIASKGELDVIFGLNVCLRRSDGSWNYTNPLEILEYVASKGYSFGWELGNEPNHLGKFNRSISAEKLGKDFVILREILDKNPEYGSLLVGPDVTRPRKPSLGAGAPALGYLKSFLSVARDAVDAVTWHQYYFDQRTCKVKDFYDPDILDYLLHQVQMINSLLDTVTPDKRQWLGETDSAWGGGAAGMTDTYVGGFTWLDKLGLAARLGTEVIIRQSFFHGKYALVNDALDPNPDYWLSLLHKRLVGHEVLDVKDGLEEGRVVRLYAHCTNTAQGQYQDGSVTVMALNLNTEDSVGLRLSGDLGGLPVDQYLLTPDRDDITSKFVKLNGDVLMMVDDNTLPIFRPVQIAPGDPLVLPPLTFGFYVVPNAMAKACLSSLNHAVI